MTDLMRPTSVVKEDTGNMIPSAAANDYSLSPTVSIGWKSSVRSQMATMMRWEPPLTLLSVPLGESFKALFRSITSDRDSEFADYKGMERSSLDKKQKRTIVFYAYAGRAWERGITENYNGKTRWFLPNGTDFATFYAEEVMAETNLPTFYAEEATFYAEDEPIKWS
jgi:hypothetical protein